MRWQPSRPRLPSGRSPPAATAARMLQSRSPRRSRRRLPRASVMFPRIPTSRRQDGRILRGPSLQGLLRDDIPSSPASGEVSAEIDVFELGVENAKPGEQVDDLAVLEEVLREPLLAPLSQDEAVPLDEVAVAVFPILR